MDIIVKPQHTKMLNIQQALTSERAQKILSIINGFHKIDCRFKDLTSFAKAISEKLRELEKSKVTHTTLLRSNSPYRKIVEKGWNKSNKIIEQLNDKKLEKIIMASKLRELKEEVNLQKKIIEKLQLDLAVQRSKNDILLTDKLPNEDVVVDIYIPFKKLLDVVCFSKSTGYLNFDPSRKTIVEPLRKTEVFSEVDFPEGFIEWYRDSYS